MKKLSENLEIGDTVLLENERTKKMENHTITSKPKHSSNPGWEHFVIYEVDTDLIEVYLWEGEEVTVK